MSLFAFQESELPLLAALLLDVASADHELAASELAMIRDLLRELGGVDELPDAVIDVFIDYDPATFDVAGTCAALGVETPARRRQLMALAGSVIVADGRIDPGEDAWLVRLAGLLGETESGLASFRSELVAAMGDLTADRV